MTEKAEATRLFKLANYTDAIAYYKRAVNSSPASEHPKLWSNIALCHYKLGQYPQGLVAARIASDLDPHWAKAAYRVAVGLKHTGAANEALVTCNYAEALVQDSQERREICAFKSQLFKEARQEIDPKSKKIQSAAEMTANNRLTPRNKQTFTLDVVLEEVNKALHRHTHLTGQPDRVLTRVEGNTWFMKNRKKHMRPMTPAQFYPTAESTEAQERAYWKFVCCCECQQRNIPVVLAIQYLLDQGYNVTDRAGRSVIMAGTVDCQTDPTRHSNPLVSIDGQEYELLEPTRMMIGGRTVSSAFAHHTLACVLSTWDYDPSTGRPSTYVDLSAPQYYVMSRDKNKLPMVVSHGHAMSIGAGMPYVKRSNLPTMFLPGMYIDMYFDGINSMTSDAGQRKHHVNQSVASALSSLLGGTVAFDVDTFVAEEQRTLLAKQQENVI